MIKLESDREPKIFIIALKLIFNGIVNKKDIHTNLIFTILAVLFVKLVFLSVTYPYI